MQTSLSNILYGHLKMLHYWIHVTKSFWEPFTFTYEYKVAVFHPKRKSRVSTYWVNIHQDLDALVDAGYLTKSEEDDTTYYQLTEASMRLFK